MHCILPADSRRLLFDNRKHKKNILVQSFLGREALAAVPTNHRYALMEQQIERRTVPLRPRPLY